MVFDMPNINLYHGTNFPFASDILRVNKLAAKTEQTINGIYQVGVSLSRCPDSSMMFGRVIFHLDRTKLNRKYRLIPFDYFKGEIDPWFKTPQKEFEEFVASEISNLTTFLTSITVIILPSDYMYGYDGGAMRNYVRPFFNTVIDLGMEELVNSNIPRRIDCRWWPEYETPFFPRKKDIRGLIAA
jgi:hypothetical protein